MTNEDIRDRIAQLEAKAERRSQPKASPHPDAEEDLWDRLFDATLPGRDGSDNNPFSLEEWLAEGLRGLRGYLRSQGLDEEFWGHMHAAEREFLLAWRCLIDARLRRWEERQKSNPPDPGRRQAIDIEFE